MEGMLVCRKVASSINLASTGLPTRVARGSVRAMSTTQCPGPDCSIRDSAQQAFDHAPPTNGPLEKSKEELKSQDWQKIIYLFFFSMQSLFRLGKEEIDLTKRADSCVA